MNELVDGSTVIELQTALTILIGVLIPIISWVGWITLQISGIRENTKEIQGLHRCVDELTQAVRELTHYTKWLAETTTGTKPPPPMNHNVGGGKHGRN